MSVAIWKTLHKKLLSLLSYSTPLTILVFLVCLTLLFASSTYLFVGVLHTFTYSFLGLGPNPYQPTPVPSHQALGVARDAYDNLAQYPFLEKEYNPFPIDVVYTWVNGSDPLLQATLQDFKLRMGLLTEEEKEDIKKSEKERKLMEESNKNKSETASALMSSNRFRDNNELRYSLRSLYKYAGWIRKIFLVTNGQIPSWLNLKKNSRIEVISHDMIFPNKSHLPTFSSPAIESHLHEIPGLSKYFLYFNDDILLGNYVEPSDWYSSIRNEYKLFLAWEIPGCAQGCTEAWIGDGFCDKKCNVEDCEWDGGDCEVEKEEGDEEPIEEPQLHVGPKKSTPTTSKSTPSATSKSPTSSATSKTTTPSSSSKSPNSASASIASTDEEDDTVTDKDSLTSSSTCAPGCALSSLGNLACEPACNVRSCAFDLGDCGYDSIRREFNTLKIEQQQKKYQIEEYSPGRKEGLLLNLTSIFPKHLHSRITEASHDNPAIIQQAFVNTHEGLMFLLLERELPHPGHQHTKQRRVEIVVGGVSDPSDSDSASKSPAASLKEEHHIEFAFNLTQPRIYNIKPGWRGDGTRIIPATPSSTTKTASSPTTVTTTSSTHELTPAAAAAVDESNFALAKELSAVIGNADGEEEDVEGSEINPNGEEEEEDTAGENDFVTQYTFEQPRATPAPPPPAKSTPAAPASKYTTKSAAAAASINTGDDDDSADQEEEEVAQAPTSTRSSYPSQQQPLRRTPPVATKPVGGPQVVETSDAHLQSLMELMHQRTTEAASKKQSQTQRQQQQQQRQRPKLQRRSPAGGGRKLLEIASPATTTSSADDIYDRLRINSVPSSMSADESLHDKIMIMLRDREVDEELMKRYAQQLMLEEENGLVDHESDTSSSLLSTLPATSRRLLGLDLYGSSLRHVHSVYNKYFNLHGVKRFAAAHMPHMLNREILYEMNRIFSAEFNQTSSAHFRQKNDMQFAFAYTYFIIHKKKEWIPILPINKTAEASSSSPSSHNLLIPPTISPSLLSAWTQSFFDPEIWHTEFMDSDGDDVLSYTEVGNMVEWLVSEKTLKDKTKLKGLVHDTYEALYNISKIIYAEDGAVQQQVQSQQPHATVSVASSLPSHHLSGLITKDIILNNRKLLDKIRDKYQTLSKYRHTMGDKSAVRFHMIQSNYMKVREDLNELYHSKPKFICLNDDMGDAEDASQLTVKAQEKKRAKEEKEWRKTVRESLKVEEETKKEDEERELRRKERAKVKASQQQQQQQQAGEKSSPSSDPSEEGYYNDDGDWVEYEDPVMTSSPTTSSSNSKKYAPPPPTKPTATPRFGHSNLKYDAKKLSSPSTPGKVNHGAAAAAATRSAGIGAGIGGPNRALLASRASPARTARRAPPARKAQRQERGTIKQQQNVDEDDDFVSSLYDSERKRVLDDEADDVTPTEEEDDEADLTPLPVTFAPLPPIAPQHLTLGHSDPQRIVHRTPVEKLISGEVKEQANQADSEDELSYFQRIERIYSVIRHKIMSPREHVKLRQRMRDEEIRRNATAAVEAEGGKGKKAPTTTATAASKSSKKKPAVPPFTSPIPSPPPSDEPIWPLTEKVLSKHYSIQLTQVALQNFYERYVPTPCELELPDGETNPFLHLNEYNAWKQEKATRKFRMATLYAIVACLLVLAFTWRYLRRVKCVNDCMKQVQAQIRALTRNDDGIGGRNSDLLPGRHSSPQRRFAAGEATSSAELQQMVMHRKNSDGLTV